LNVHAKVIKAMKHLIKDFDLDIEAVKAFNTRDVLSNLSYLKNSNTRRNNNNNNNNNNENNNNNNNNNKKNKKNNNNNKTRRNRH